MVPGEVIIRQNDFSEDMFVVGSGSFDVVASMHEARPPEVSKTGRTYSKVVIAGSSYHYSAELAMF